MSARSVRRKLSSLRAFFRYQMHEGIRTENPTESVVVPKIGKKLPVFVPDYKMSELLDKKRAARDDFSVFRDLMILMMAYCTGMRRSELVGLKLADIDLSGGVILVNGKGDKQRLVPILEELSEEIREYLEVRNGKVDGRHSFFFITDAGAPANEKFIYRHVKKCLEDAGLKERITDSGMDMETYLYKDFDDTGIEISGGEAQKIAIARAVYKNSPFILLDEPTAALDPLAEFEIYTNFDKIIGTKTAIYISHRLSSCQFCEKIAVFHEGSLVQYGSHNKLLEDKSGKYYEMWNAQAQYYQQA